MAAPLLFAVPAIGALADIAPRAIAEVIERGGDINDSKSVANRTLEATLRGEKMITEMKRTADTLRLYKGQ